MVNPTPRGNVDETDRFRRSAHSNTARRKYERRSSAPMTTGSQQVRRCMQDSPHLQPALEMLLDYPAKFLPLHRARSTEMSRQLSLAWIASLDTTLTSSLLTHLMKTVPSRSARPLRHDVDIVALVGEALPVEDVGACGGVETTDPDGRSPKNDLRGSQAFLPDQETFHSRRPRRRRSVDRWCQHKRSRAPI